MSITQFPSLFSCMQCKKKEKDDTWIRTAVLFIDLFILFSTKIKLYLISDCHNGKKDR